MNLNTFYMLKIKYALLFLSLSISRVLSAQDGKLSWYYPKLGEVDARSGKNGSYSFSTHGASGCVSGNCKSGTGEYLVAMPSYDSSLGFMDINTTIKLTRLKGQFSNDGKDFEGKVYMSKVYYNVTYKKDDPRLVPKEKIETRDEAYWHPYEVATGTMRHDGFSYKWAGWMQPVLAAGSTTTPGQPSTLKAYLKGEFSWVKIQYTPGGTYSVMEGRTLPNGDLLGGRLHFADGSKYEGFLHDGRRYGPGRYTSKDGKTEEGIWMLDSLAISTAVSLPKELFEPVEGTIPVIGELSFGGYAWTELKDAGNGWLYAFYSDDVYIGKAADGKLDGPGFYFTKRATPNYENGMQWCTFRTGLFKDGKLDSGMRLWDVISIIQKTTGSVTTAEYIRKSTTTITGAFKDDQLKPSCGKRIRYDGNGNAIELTEGYFMPGHFKSEIADGWVYLNDWEAKRESANLRYMHNNEDYLVMDGTPNYVTWFTRGMEASGSANFCFPSMKVQASPILAMIKNRHDSVVALVAKKEVKIVANPDVAEKKVVEKTESVCEIERKKYNYVAGDLFQDGEGDSRKRYLVTGSYNCYTKSFPVLSQSWYQATKQKGYWRTMTTNMPAATLQLAKKFAESAVACAPCSGAGTIPETMYSDVGGNSGYTAVGGGWAVKNPETHWKSTVQVPCKQCGGIGFIRK